MRMLERLLLVTSSLILPAFCGTLQESGGVDFGPGPTSIGATTSCTANAFGPASISPLDTTCNLTANTTATYKSLADYGVLKTSASFTSTAETNGYIDVHTTAFFFDNFSLNANPLGPTPDSIQVFFTVTGSNTPGATMNLSISGPGGGNITAHSAGTYSFTAVWSGLSLNLPITGSMQSIAHFEGGAIGTQTVTSNFYSTAVLSAITVFDSSHNDISSSISQSGGSTSYNLGALPSSVPEPATVLLTGAAAALLAIARKRFARA